MTDELNINVAGHPDIIDNLRRQAKAERVLSELKLNDMEDHIKYRHRGANRIDVIIAIDVMKVIVGIVLVVAIITRFTL